MSFGSKAELVEIAWLLDTLDTSLQLTCSKFPIYVKFLENKYVIDKM